MNPFSLLPSDYEFGNPIGFGSSAIVYLAKYKPLNRHVAIKRVDIDAFERSQIDQLRNELQIQGSCRHPHVASLFGSYLEGSYLNIIQPYFSMGSVLDLLKTVYPNGMPEPCIASILKQALSGLEYLHKNNLIHRDIKAGNLLVDDDGTVALADFGVSSSLTGTFRKTFVGTPCWMAPEVMEQSVYDSKADIWSLGITALEMAQGSAPYAKLPPLKVLMMTLQSDPPTLDRTQTKYPFSDTFVALVGSCLKRDPKQRLTATQLLQHPYFQNAKPPSYLKDTLLSNVPPVNQRQKPIPKASQPPPKQDVLDLSWDFEEVPASAPVILPLEDDTPTTAGSGEHQRKPPSPALLPLTLPPLQQLNLSSTPTEIKKGRFSVVSPEEMVHVSRTPSVGSGMPVPQVGQNPSRSSPIPVTSSSLGASGSGVTSSPQKKESRFQVSTPAPVSNVQVVEKLQWLYRQNSLQRQGILELAELLGVELEGSMRKD